MILIQNEQEVMPCTQELLDFCEQVLARAVTLLQLPAAAEVSVLLVDNSAIQALNSEYRDIDAPTDVLSFSQLEGVELFGDPDVLVLGDIVVSIEKTVEQANDYGHSFDRELAFLLVHGLLHLVGYEHDDEFTGLMHDKQEEVMEALALQR